MSWLILGGISETGRYYVAYVYAIEIFCSKGKKVAALMIFTIFDICKVCVALYFWQSTSKSWHFLFYLGLICCLISLFFTIFMLPESPRYLFEKGKFEEAEIVLKKI